jgi:hypothetical protein
VFLEFILPKGAVSYLSGESSALEEFPFSSSPRITFDSASNFHLVLYNLTIYTSLCISLKEAYAVTLLAIALLSVYPPALVRRLMTSLCCLFVYAP